MPIHYRKHEKGQEVISWVRDAIKKLKKYDDAYYNSDSPKISDEEYDLFREKTERRLKKLYRTYKLRMQEADDYFSGVRAKVRESKRSEDLPIRLGSLKKTKNDNDKGMSNFIARSLKASQSIAKEFSKRKQPKLYTHYKSLVSYVMSPKLDGLTFVLHYRKNELYAAYSGGDGIKGQPKLSHAKALIKKGLIPSKLSSKYLNHFDYKDYFVVGEIVCSKSRFKKVVKQQKKDGVKKPYNEVRNAASGWVNSDTPPSLLTDAVDFVAYELKTKHGDVGCDLEITDLHIGASLHANKNLTVGILDKLGFLTYKESPLFQVVSDNTYSDGFKRMLNSLLDKVKDQDYPLDGIVVEVSDAKVRAEMGVDNKGTPYFAVAYKVSADSAVASGTGEETKVKEIEWNTSKIGALKPTLIYKAVKIGNSTFTQATGNNYSWLVAKGIGVGTKISIVKAGDVIPKAYFADKTPASADSIKPSKCQCGAKVVNPKDEDGKRLPDYYCVKETSCPIAIKEQLFASLKATKVTGLGVKNIQKLYDSGYTDIFQLIEAATDKKEAKKILSIEGFGKSILETLSVAIPEKLSKMGTADLMVMSNIFVRPGLSLAKASFDKAAKVIKEGEKEGKISRSACIKAIGEAKGTLLYENFDLWLKYRKRLKKLGAG